MHKTLLAPYQNIASEHYSLTKCTTYIRTNASHTIQIPLACIIIFQMIIPTAAHHTTLVWSLLSTMVLLDSILVSTITTQNMLIKIMLLCYILACCNWNAMTKSTASPQTTSPQRKPYIPLHHCFHANQLNRGHRPTCRSYFLPDSHISLHFQPHLSV